MQVNFVFFDMDGVLVDSERHWHDIESTFLQRLILDWSEADQHSILGMSIYQIYEVLVRERGLALSKTEFMHAYRDLSCEIYGELSELIPGVRECLDTLSTLQIPAALVSSAPRAWVDIVLSRFELEDVFAFSVSSDDVGGVGKPAPDVYLHALGQAVIHSASSSVQPIAIEDSKKGIASAKSAGIFCLGFRNGFNCQQDFSEADEEINSLHQVLEFFRPRGA